jgi:hypothetical protein
MVRSIFLLPDRWMLFTPTAGVPDFSAMIRSCSSMTARAAASPSMALKNVARYSAIGTQRAVFVNHIEKREFNARCRLAGHFGFPVIVQRCQAPSAASRSSSHGRQDQIAPPPSLGGQTNGKDGQNSNACTYIAAGHQINPPPKEAAHGI